MKEKNDIQQMGARFDIETPHVEHVARLALDLFDGFSPLPGIRRSDRALLAAAARLHDIGVASDPEHHVEAGIRILKDHPLSGFSSKDWKSIILIVSLHRRNWRPLLTEKVYSEFGKKRLVRIKTLAAILRIADGLDHGHIQDASIRFCRRGKKVDRVGVRCRWYGGNVTWAEGKSDLWESVFKRTFRFKVQKPSSKGLFEGVVRGRERAVPAARRILYSQYDVMRDNVTGMLEGHDLECLHDYRVAMRRFRAALRMFRPLLKETSAEALRVQMDELSDRMSPVRDTHVLFQIFQAIDLPEGIGEDFMRVLEGRVKQATQDLAGILESAECLETVRILSRFLRVELPALERKDKGPDYKAFAKARFSPLVKRIRKADAQEVQEHVEQMHELRKLCRRGRYYAEFAAPARGKKANRAARQLKAVAASLGDVRDAQVHRETLKRFREGHLFTAILETRQHDGWCTFEKAWRKMMKN